MGEKVAARRPLRRAALTQKRAARRPGSSNKANGRQQRGRGTCVGCELRRMRPRGPPPEPGDSMRSDWPETAEPLCCPQAVSTHPAGAQARFITFLQTKGRCPSPEPRPVVRPPQLRRVACPDCRQCPAPSVQVPGTDRPAALLCHLHWRSRAALVGWGGSAG